MSANRGSGPGYRGLLIALAALALLVAAALVGWFLLRDDEDEPAYRGPPIEAPGGIVQERELVLLESGPGEDRTTFLRRVGRVLVDHADRTGHEACGQVCQNHDSTVFAVQVVTNDAHIMCAMWTNCPTGYLPTGTNIHAHCPGRRVLRANAADQALSGHRHRFGDRLKPCDPHQFSYQDIAAGPGYLATPNRLLFQAGRGRPEDLGPLLADEPPSLTLSAPETYNSRSLPQ